MHWLSFTVIYKVFNQRDTLSPVKLLKIATHPNLIVLYCLHFSDKKSERAKDIHLLKRLTTLLRSREVEPGKRDKSLDEMREV